MEPNCGRLKLGRPSSTASARKERIIKMASERVSDQGQSSQSHSQAQEQEQHQPSKAPHSQTENADVPYPGGPYDLSLLRSYGSHVACKIWQAELRGPLKCVNNGKKICRLYVPDEEWFSNALRNSGLRDLLLTPFEHVDPCILSAFAERWHMETSSFHLPIGEMTITLDDVSCLLHLPIKGKSVEFVYMNRRESETYASKHLGCDLEEVCEQTEITRGSHLKFNFLKRVYENHLAKLQLLEQDCVRDEVTIDTVREYALKCYFLYLVGTTIFSDKSANYVSITYLQLFEDLSSLNDIAWGTAALAYLYDQLNRARLYKTKQMAGYMTLLQSWIMEHFPGVLARDFNHNFDASVHPRAYRFISLRGNSAVEPYREHLDGLLAHHIIWTPFEDHRNTHPFEEISLYSGWIRCGYTMTAYLPERVLRQFGYVQTIPRDPTISAPVTLRPSDVDDRFIEYLDYVLPAEARGARVFNPWDTEFGYMRWYMQVSHPYLIPIPPGDPPRPAEAEVLATDEGDDIVREDLLPRLARIRAIASDILCSDDLQPGTSVHKLVQEILDEARGAFRYRRKRGPEKMTQ